MMLQARGLAKAFGKGAARVHAIQEASLDVGPGEVVLVMGPSGGGKTTLLSIAGCLSRPDSGDVAILGRRVARLSADARTRVRRTRIGYVFQNFQLLSNLTARENVEVALNVNGIRGARARKRAMECLRLVGVDHRARLRPDELSGGEKQRVAIARALANEPALILADEPTANLDSQTGHEIVELLRRCTRNGRRSALIVSHDRRIMDIADRIYTMEDGVLRPRSR